MTNYQIRANHPVLAYFSEVVSDRELGDIISAMVSHMYEISEVRITMVAVTYSICQHVETVAVKIPCSCDVMGCLSTRWVIECKNCGEIVDNLGEDN